MTTIISLITLCIFGYIFAGIFVNDKLERLSLSYILGLGIFTLFWFLVNLAGVPYTLLSGLVLILLLSVLSLGLSKFLFKKNSNKKNQSIFKYLTDLNISEKIVFGVIIFLFVSSFIGDLYWPVRHWDSLTLYDFRSRIFAETGYMTKLISTSGFFGYPLLTSLAHTLVYVSGFKNPSFIYSFFYTSLIFVSVVNFKKLKLPRIVALVLTLVVAISPRIFDHSLTAYTNLPYIIYLVFGSIYLYLGIKNKNFGIYILSAVLIGLSTWTRSTEPFWLSCVVVSIIFSIINRKWHWPVVYLFVFLLIMLPWRFFLSYNHAGNANVAGEVVSTASSLITNFSITSIISVLNYVSNNVVHPFLSFFILMFLIMLYKLINKSKNWIYCAIILLNLGLLLSGVVIFSQNISYWQDIPDSLTRMTLFIPIMTIFLFSEEVSESFMLTSENKKSGHKKLNEKTTY